MSAEHDDELWFVELPDGRTRCMSLEELDEAYQKGEIDEHARVRKDGESEWSTLAAIAGLDDTTTEAAPISVRPGQPPEAGTYAREEAFAETVRSNPLSALSAGPSSLAPYAISSDAPPSLAPTPTPGAFTTGLDDLDDPYAGMQKSSKGLVFGLVAAVAIAIGVTGFTVSRAQGGGEVVVQAMPAAAAQALPGPAIAQAKAEEPAPAPAPKLTDDQKKQLSALDKKHEAESAKKARERAEKAATQQVRRTRGKSSEPFVKGGSKYDPLNGAL